MAQLRNNPISVDDEKFFKSCLNELSNFEAILKPQMHQILMRLEKTSYMRASLSTVAVSQLIRFKDRAENNEIVNIPESSRPLQKINEELDKRLSLGDDLKAKKQF